MLVFVIGGGPGIVAARAVHQDVAGPQVPEHLLVHLFQRFGVQHVGLVALADIALGLHFIGQLFHGFFVQVQRRHFRARLGVSPGHIAAQHAARAGNDHDFAGKVHVQRKVHDDSLLSNSAVRQRSEWRVGS